MAKTRPNAMWFRRPILASFILLAQASSAMAQESDRDAILALMEKAFAAIRSGNQDDWRAIQLAEGSKLSFRASPGGPPEVLDQMRITNNEDFVAALGPDGHEYTERWTREPTILVRGPIAVIWGDYEFRIDGNFSHCGVESADLVKMDGEWKMTNVMWTVEKMGCPTASVE